MKKLVVEIGEWNINCLELSRKWDVPKSTVHRWKQMIADEIGIISIESVGRNVHHAMTHNVQTLQRQIAKTNGDMKLKNVRVFNDTVKTLTEFLESYRYKDKVAEKHEHNVMAPVTFNIDGIENKYPRIKKRDVPTRKRKTKKVHGKSKNSNPS